jgi:uncharacterized phiE125 gp8 family phage protein
VTDTPYILDLVTAPVGQVLTIDDMQAFGYIVEPDQFGVVMDCIATATNVVEGDTGRQLLTATYDVSWRRFPGCWGELVLPRVPVASVTSVKYYDTAGTLQTLSSSDYTVNDGSAHAAAYIIPAFNEQWPSTYGHDRDVVVRFVCGYGAVSAIPSELKMQVAILANSLFRSRQAESCGEGGRSMVYDVLSQFNRHQEFV